MDKQYTDFLDSLEISEHLEKRRQDKQGESQTETPAPTPTPTPTIEALQKEITRLTEINQRLYKENISLEAENTQKEFIIGEHEDAKAEAKKWEKFYLEAHAEKLKLSAYFLEIQNKITELKTLGAIEF